MIIQTKQPGARIVAGSVGLEKPDMRAKAFLLLIGFLLFWSLYGNALEEQTYDRSTPLFTSIDQLGVRMVMSRAGEGQATIIVDRIDPNSPAGRAGLEAGDLVIGIDGRLISSLAMARHIVASKQDIETLRFTVIRNGRNKDISVRVKTPWLERQNRKNMELKERPFSTGRKIFIIVVFLKLSAILFYMLYKRSMDRTRIVLIFGATILVLGSFFRNYSPLDALLAVKFNTLSLLLGISIISVVLDEAGFFERVAYRVSRLTGNSTLSLLFVFCLLTYFFSMLVNNLITILIVVPITLNLTEALEMDPRPIVVGEIIASNLGGASTMIGDFPNMLIATEAGIGFIEFIVFMMPICLILLGLLLIYLWSTYGRSPRYTARTKASPLKEPAHHPRNHRITNRALFVLFHMIFLMLLADRISLHPSAIALLAGAILFLFSGVDHRTIIKGIGFNDLLFFFGLFVVVGGLEATGLLLYITRAAIALSFGKPWFLCLILMWSAAFLTAFLNAGPATAFLFPIVLSFSQGPPGHVIWWALSLGVLAGSSATILGATAGPVAVTLVENHHLKRTSGSLEGGSLSFAGYARTGVPVALIFLCVSSVYITYLCFTA
ncbi:MAG: SLC13 family permease [Desulfobacterales bacterium]